VKPSLALLALALFAAPPPDSDPSATGPLELMITYRCEPARRPAFREYLETTMLARLRAWQAEGWLAEFRLLFNWYVDSKTWDAAAMLRFRDYPDVARWKAIEKGMPGGLCAEGLALGAPVQTDSADLAWKNPGAGEAPAESVFLVIPYKYLGLVDEYKAYAAGYVVPQLEGWLQKGVLASYRVYLNRFPTGDRWGSLLVLEYKDIESFGRRNAVRAEVRAILREDPKWKAFSDVKKTIRQEAEPVIAEALRPAAAPAPKAPAQAPEPTRRFEIAGDRARLGGAPVELWGLRCGNALHSQTVTERHVRALDTMTAHGINLIGVYIQGSNGGWPDVDAGLNGYDRFGRLNPAVAGRLEWLIREADARGMVVMVGLFSPRKDQELLGEGAVKNAIEETARFLVARGLRNVFVDIMHEYDHSRTDLEIFRDPGGAEKKARLAGWFKAAAPEIPVGVCPYNKSKAPQTFPGMDIHLIQKDMPIPPSGFVVNVETQKQDCYENDGIFPPESLEYVLEDCRRYRAEPRAALLFHAGFIQGIGNRSGSAPHAEMGGRGTGTGDRGVRFYYEWVRDNVGRWEYPRHVPFVPQAAPAEPLPTSEFELREGIPHLGGQAVKLWGLRCHNALLSPAVAERLANNLDNMRNHGINLIGLSLQGTSGGFPDVDAGPNAYAPDGRLIPAFAGRLELLVREADRRQMAVCLTLLMPRKDQLLRDENAVRRAIEETGRLLHQKNLRNVFVNLFHEFDHPTRIDHDLFQEPDGGAKKARLSAWFKAAAPGIEAGICPNHSSGSPAPTRAATSSSSTRACRFPNPDSRSTSSPPTATSRATRASSTARTSSRCAASGRPTTETRASRCSSAAPTSRTSAAGSAPARTSRWAGWAPASPTAASNPTSSG